MNDIFYHGSNKLFDKFDDKNQKLLQQFLPALTTWDRITHSMAQKPLQNRS